MTICSVSSTSTSGYQENFWVYVKIEEVDKKGSVRMITENQKSALCGHWVSQRTSTHHDPYV
jgi:hypothetical protein